MNRVLLMMLLMISSKLVSAQDFIIKGITPDLYLSHQVAAKETWYAIARKYNLPPGQLASYNKLNVQTPLEVGQNLKVPLTPLNFTQNEAKAANETLVPVYHVVQEREWMYRVSVNHNKVPIEQLEKWNSIKRDEAKAGMKLIVGHLKVKDANAAATVSSQKTTPQAPAPGSTSATDATNNPANSSPASNNNSAVSSGGTQATSAGNGGYFKASYAGQNRKQSGVAGIFKSTSGWNDGKYYALMNNVTVGTIIRIDFPQTNKTVYAKVLGELPEMKESAGLSLRISDAAAREVGATANKFSVNIIY
jgi:LysM repeat protein